MPRLALAVALLIATPGAAATLHCAAPDTLADTLKSDFNETLVGTGRADTEGLLGHIAMGHETTIALYAAPDGKTWTFVLIIDGKACPLGSGDDWRLGKPGAPS